MKKISIIMLVLFLSIILIFILENTLLYEDKSVLQGTYQCKDLQLDHMIFDGRNDNTFEYYQFIDSNVYNQKIHTGIYFKIETLTYQIESESFKNQTLILNEDTFFIQIDGIDYLFYKVSDLPTYVTHPANKEN